MSVVLLHETVHLLGHVHVFDRRGDLVLLLVAHLSHDVTQVLPRTRLGQMRNHIAYLKASHRANVLADQLHTLAGGQSLHR